LSGNLSIKAESLSFAYNKKPILKDIDFEIKKGSFVSIIGPNGAGKSTLVNIMSKVLLPSTGELEIEGKNIKELTSFDVAKRIAVVPQYFEIGFDFLVYDIVLMGRYPHIKRYKGESNSDYEIAKKVMELTKTLTFKSRKYNELSGGEKQRVIIAQALAQDTPIIILDEPTSHLDINFQIEFMELFYDLNKKHGKTIIGIFHDINLALQYSDTIIMLKEGSIFSSGSSSDVITRSNIMSVFNSDVYISRNPFTGKLYVSPNFNFRIQKESSNLKKELRIHVIGGGGAASQILIMLHNYGCILSTGVVNNLDTDLNTAQELGIIFVNEAPFSPISKDAHSRNLDLIRSSDIVILPCIEFGNGNFLNLEAVKEACRLNKKIIIVDIKDISERDHIEGKAIELYNSIINKDVYMVKSNEDIIKILSKIH
jgi:iron complex transport system ATP-binding protein